LAKQKSPPFAADLSEHRKKVGELTRTLYEIVNRNRLYLVAV